MGDPLCSTGESQQHEQRDDEGTTPRNSAAGALSTPPSQGPVFSHGLRRTVQVADAQDACEVVSKSHTVCVSPQPFLETPGSVRCTKDNCLRFLSPLAHPIWNTRPPNVGSLTTPTTDIGYSPP